MTTRREIGRMEKAMASIPEPGCPGCRHRRGRHFLVEGGVRPTRCAACGIVPEFVIDFGCLGDGGDGDGAEEVGGEESP